jgi:hypothetical protein
MFQSCDYPHFICMSFRQFECYIYVILWAPYRCLCIFTYRNVVGSNYGRSSTKIAHFIPDPTNWTQIWLVPHFMKRRLNGGCTDRIHPLVLQRTFHRWFLLSCTSFGWSVSEEKIKMWKVSRWQTTEGGCHVMVKASIAFRKLMVTTGDSCFWLADF